MMPHEVQTIRGPNAGTGTASRIICLTSSEVICRRGLMAGFISN
jgi:hypothetical protein